MYEDIIKLSRPKSKYKKATMTERAGQFMPFSALKGYDECIENENRYVEEKRLLSEEQVQELNQKLQQIDSGTHLKLVYFKPDFIKQGGLYLDYEGIIKKFDKYHLRLIFDDDYTIDVKNIYDITEIENENKNY